jgi:uncharacterized protein YecE (DUF72 family)
MAQEAISRAISSPRIHVGTSGWGYPSWKPDFYPKDVPQKKFLPYYASVFNAVEVNYSFRQMLKAKTIGDWLQQTPEHFMFAVKAHQQITHIKRLRNAEDSVKFFASSIEPLFAAKRLGPILIQLPPNLKGDVGLLREFLTIWPRAVRCTFEFRHASWFNDEIYETLRERNCALCIAENEELKTPEVMTANFAYFRLRRPDYSSDDRQAIAAHLRELAADREVFAFFKHEENPQSAVWAKEVLDAAIAS